MSVVPSGIFSIHDLKLQELLAASATFQSWVGVDPGDTEAAKLRIYLEAAVNYTRPFALIAMPVDGPWGQGMIAGGVQHHFDRPSGAIELAFEDDVAEAHQGPDHMADAAYAFRNVVGSILSNMQVLAGRGASGLIGGSGYFPLTAIEKVEGPSRSDPDMETNEGDFYGVRFWMHYGFGGE